MDGTQMAGATITRSITLDMSSADGAPAASRFDTKWAYDFHNNKSESIVIQKAQYAFCEWKDELKENQRLEDRRKADLSELWTGVYQIIGFYSVFQEVIYQGVTAMSSILTCGFYRIPVILSVLASAATILSIYVKLSSVVHLSASLYKESAQGMRLQNRIEACYGLAVEEFSIQRVDAILRVRLNARPSHPIAYTKSRYSNARYLKWAVLVFLTIFSTLFSYLDYIVMCHMLLLEKLSPISQYHSRVSVRSTLFCFLFP